MTNLNLMNGIFITIEGIDGSGKTTQGDILYEWLRRSLPRERVIRTREPRGMHIRNLLLEDNSKRCLSALSELFAFEADRVQHITELIEPELERRSIILCDRFIDSTLAYQGYGRGIPLDEVRQANMIATRGITPDLTIWLDVPVEDALNRIDKYRRYKQYDRREMADIEFHHRVKKGYEAISFEHPNRIIRIDGTDDRDSVAHQIVSSISKKIIDFPRPINYSFKPKSKWKW